ncbi:MAG: 16S rRNA (uracil(1498)-N(3))-methyltransferase [Pseudomonadota bacterium]|nr:16S rRNA (uracil(1498)-N(3))-methyltransferase [Pseudomonadota bacterium]
MPRFYCDLSLAPDHLVTLPDAVARHAVGVLRLRAGEAVVLFNGDGAEYHGVLENVGGKGASVRLASRHEPARESPLQVRLAQGISSGERMDYTLQKAVELGVTAIQPLTMRRSVVRLNEEKAIKRRAHWQGVVSAACEQCGRNVLPPVAEIQEFTAWVRTLSPPPPSPLAPLPGGEGLGVRERRLQLPTPPESGATPPTKIDQALAIHPSSLSPAPPPRGEGSLRLLLDPEGDLCLRDLPPPTSPILLLAGPEGGFDPAERKLARAAGFHGLRLGPRVLRTETAALAALAAMQAVWGDFR